MTADYTNYDFLKSAYSYLLISTSWARVGDRKVFKILP